MLAAVADELAHVGGPRCRTPGCSCRCCGARGTLGRRTPGCRRAPQAPVKWWGKPSQPLRSESHAPIGPWHVCVPEQGGKANTPAPANHRPLGASSPQPLPTGSGAHGLRRQVSALAGVPAGRHTLAKCVPIHTVEACLPQTQISPFRRTGASGSRNKIVRRGGMRACKPSNILLGCLSPHEQHAYGKVCQCCWAFKHIGACTGGDAGPW